jgi:hypothetical protein
MTREELERLAADYWCWYTMNERQDDEDFDFLRFDELEWAHEAVEEAVEKSSPALDVVALLQVLADRALSDAALGYLGAGPDRESGSWCHGGHKRRHRLWRASRGRQPRQLH